MSSPPTSVNPSHPSPWFGESEKARQRSAARVTLCVRELVIGVPPWHLPHAIPRRSWGRCAGKGSCYIDSQPTDLNWPFAPSLLLPTFRISPVILGSPSSGPGQLERTGPSLGRGHEKGWPQSCSPSSMWAHLEGGPWPAVPDTLCLAGIFAARFLGVLVCLEIPSCWAAGPRFYFKSYMCCGTQFEKCCFRNMWKVSTNICKALHTKMSLICFHLFLYWWLTHSVNK